MVLLIDKKGLFIDCYTTVAAYARDYGLNRTKYNYLCNKPWIGNKKVYKDHILIKYTPIK